MHSSYKRATKGFLADLVSWSPGACTEWSKSVWVTIDAGPQFIDSVQDSYRRPHRSSSLRPRLIDEIFFCIFLLCCRSYATLLAFCLINKTDVLFLTLLLFFLEFLGKPQQRNIAFIREFLDTLYTWLRGFSPLINFLIYLYFAEKKIDYTRFKFS